MQQMTYQEVLQGLFDALTDLKVAVTKHGYAPEYGICGEIDTHWEQAFGEGSAVRPLQCLEGDSPSEFLSKRMAEWPAGTGSSDFPVPAERGCKCTNNALVAFITFEGRWVGAQLELRLELIDYLLNELSDRLEKANANSNSN